MQYILLQSYIGSSNFTYEVTCTGRILGLGEALALRLTNQDELRRHARSSYTAAWYEISAHDRIDIRIEDDNGNQDIIFFVPEGGLPNPPVNLFDERAEPHVHEYLKKHCSRT